MNIFNLKKEKNKSGIKFYKKVWYSITKFDKYDEMAEEGAKTALNYLYKIVFICALIFTVIQLIFLTKTYKTYSNYVAENIPELKYSEGTLAVETQEVLKLNGDIIKKMFGGNLIIDMTSEFDDTLEKYKEYLDLKDGTVILLKNKFITVNFSEDKQINSYDYSQSLNSYLTNIGKPTHFNKQDMVEYFNDINYLTMFLQYVVVYFVSYLIVFLLFIGMSVIAGFICSKALKVKLSLKELFSLSVYSYTLSLILIIVYSLLNIVFGITVQFIQIAFILIAYIFLTTVIINRKNKQIKTTSKEE